MEFKKILLFLPTYPDAPPAATLESAAFLAQWLRASITACIPQLNGDIATWPSPLGSWPADIRGLMDETVHQSEGNAHHLAEAMAKMASDYHVTAHIRRSLTTLYASPQPLIDLARLHDLTVLPSPECNSFDRHPVESAIFDSGRPVLLLPSGGKPLRRLDSVVVAWDYGREAARALADALPLVKLAKQVHVVSIFGEKGIQTSCTHADLEHYLAEHQVNFVRADRTLKDGTVSTLLASCAAEWNADLLVMGAYGHSRFREFVLGGATRGMLADPPLPVLLSH